MKVAFQLFPRINELHLFGRMAPETQKMLSPSYAPNLEALSLHASFMKEDGSLTREISPLFLNNLATLKFLSISYVTHFPQNSLHNLRQLHLHNQDYSSDTDNQMLLLDVLNSNTTLEDLMFSAVTWSIDQPSAHMCNGESHLRKISFRSMEEQDIWWLLLSLRTSPQVALSITNFDDDRNAMLHLRYQPKHFDSLFVLDRIYINLGTKTFGFVGAGASVAY